MLAVRVADDILPQNNGEWSLQHNMFRPPYGERDEIFMVTPQGRLGALIPEVHKWIIDKFTITVTPSIVYFDYHGSLTEGRWS